MSEYIGQGNVADTNPIAAANRAALQAKEQARLDKLEAERVAKKEAEFEERQRKREEARLEREARLADQIRERTAEFDKALEAERRQKAAEEEAVRKRQEAEERQRQQELQRARREEEQRLEAEENARKAAIAAEREEREAQRQASEQRRMEQLRQAERDAEAMSEMLALQRQVEDAIFMAVTAGAMSNSEGTDVRLKLRNSTKEFRERTLVEVRARLEASRPNAQSVPEPVEGEEEVFLGFGDSAGGMDGIREEDDDGDDSNSSTAEEAAAEDQQQALVDNAQQTLLKQIAVSDIADRLQNVDARDGAAIALLRYLAKELGKGSAVFNKRLGDGIDEINLYATMEPLAAIIAEAPGHLPAILSLGLMAFAGHAPLYKAVCEVNAIPADSNRWIGWVLGCRLYNEYVGWLERCKVNTALAWSVGAEKEFGKLPKNAKDTKGREKQRAAANDKVTELMVAYGLLDGPLPAARAAEQSSVVMLKFDVMASSLDGFAGRIVQHMETNDSKVAAAVAERKTEGAEKRARQALEDARAASNAANSVLHRARTDVLTLENQMEAAEARMEKAKEREATLKAELEAAQASVTKEEKK